VGIGPQNIEQLKASKDVNGLIRALKHKNWYVQDEAAYALGNIRDSRAVEPLIEVMKDEYGSVRSWAVVEALGNIGDSRAVEPLIGVLKDEYGYIQSRIVEALGRIGDKRAVEPLIEALADPNWWIRKCAAEALGRIGDKRAVEPLIEALNDKGWWYRGLSIRLAAVEALAEIGDSRAVKPLIEILKDRHIRAEVVSAINKLGYMRDALPLINTLKSKEKSAGKAGYLIGWGLGALVVAFVCFSFVAEIIYPPLEHKPATIPQEIPQNIPFSNSFKINSDDDSFIISYDQEIKVEVYFQERYSIKGLWNGSDAELSISDPDGEVFTGETYSKSWGDTIITRGGGTSSFTPWLDINFRVNKKYYRKWINAIVELDVSYPYPSGISKFVNEYDHLERSFSLFVVSPDEYNLLKQNIEWQNYQVAKEEGLLWLRILFFVVFILLGILLLFLGIRLKWRINRE